MAFARLLLDMIRFKTIDLSVAIQYKVKLLKGKVLKRYRTCYWKSYSIGNFCPVPRIEITKKIETKILKIRYFKIFKSFYKINFHINLHLEILIYCSFEVQNKGEVK